MISRGPGLRSHARQHDGLFPESRMGYRGRMVIGLFLLSEKIDILTVIISLYQPGLEFLSPLPFECVEQVLLLVLRLPLTCLRSV